jgi:predicted XRE-type DNA-binding protein
LPLASVSSSPPDSQLNVSGGDVHGDIEEPESSDADGLKIQLEISEDIEKTIESGEYAQTNENELVVDVSNSIVSNISRNNNKNNSTLILSPGVIPAENETIEDHDDEIVTSSSIINDLEKISVMNNSHILSQVSVYCFRVSTF